MTGDPGTRTAVMSRTIARIAAYHEVWPRAYALPGSVRNPGRESVALASEFRPVSPGLSRFSVAVCSPGQSVPDSTPERSDQAQHTLAKHIYAGHSVFCPRAFPNTERSEGHSRFTCDNTRGSMQA